MRHREISQLFSASVAHTKHCGPLAAGADSGSAVLSWLPALPDLNPSCLLHREALPTCNGVHADPSCK